MLRHSLLASVDLWAEFGGKIYALTSPNYTGGLTWPEMRSRLVHFNLEPWPPARPKLKNHYLDLPLWFVISM